MFEKFKQIKKKIILSLFTCSVCDEKVKINLKLKKSNNSTHFNIRNFEISKYRSF